MGTIRRRVVVEGRVQGVWFRESTRRAAEAAGVAGWVRNLLDGEVEAAFEGEPDAVERLLAFCREGPRNATVSNVTVTEERPEGETAFTIRPTPPRGAPGGP